jgi:hypothetical protein
MIRHKKKVYGLINYEMPPIFGIIISKQLATLQEIKTIYTYNECLDLLDIILVDNYNEYLISESYNNNNAK